MGGPFFLVEIVNSCGAHNFFLNDFLSDKSFFLPKISPFLLQLHTVAQNERQIKSKTKQNLELNAKSKELTQSLKQLHQSFLASNQVRYHISELLSIVVITMIYKDKQNKSELLLGSEIVIFYTGILTINVDFFVIFPE